MSLTDPFLNLGLPATSSYSSGNSILTMGMTPYVNPTQPAPSSWETSPGNQAASLQAAGPQIKQAQTSDSQAALLFNGQATQGSGPLDLNDPANSGSVSATSTYLGGVNPDYANTYNGAGTSPNGPGSSGLLPGYAAGASPTQPGLTNLTGILASKVPLRTLPDENTYTYTGSNMKIMIEPAYGSNAAGQSRPPTRKELIECTTLTISIHREKSPVRACGYINPKGFARGRRTIAGTFILTPFTVDVLYRFLNGFNGIDMSRDSGYVKVDQLPPFDATLVFADEYGHTSYRKLLGIDMLTDGTVYSVQDQITEQTITYMASDFTPLLPSGKPNTTSSYAGTPAGNGNTSTLTPWDVMGNTPAIQPTPAGGTVAAASGDTTSSR